MNIKRKIRIGYDIVLLVVFYFTCMIGADWLIINLFHGKRIDSFPLLVIFIILFTPVMIHGYMVGFRRYYCQDHDLPKPLKTKTTKKNIKTLLILGLYHVFIIVPLLIALYYIQLENKLWIGIIFCVIGGIMVIPAAHKTNRVLMDMSNKNRINNNIN